MPIAACQLGFPCSSVGKESACSAGDPGSIPGLGRSPGEGNGNPSPVSLPGKSPGQRSLVGCSPWGCKESGTTERLTLTYLNTLTEFKIGAKNRNNQCYMISRVVLSVLFHHNRKIWEVYELPLWLRW